jgi:putative transposase
LLHLKINRELHYLWRAFDHEGEVLEVVATERRDPNAALRVLKSLMNKYGGPRAIVTDKLHSYGAALKMIGNAACQECDGPWSNHRAKNSHQPFRRRERAMHWFRRMGTLQKFTSVHASIHNHFNHERHLIDRATYKTRRCAAIAEWRKFAS